MYHFGDFPDPVTKKRPSAISRPPRQTIDILGILKDISKTKGNLSEDEEETWNRSSTN